LLAKVIYNRWPLEKSITLFDLLRVWASQSKLRIWKLMKIKPFFPISILDCTTHWKASKKILVLTERKNRQFHSAWAAAYCLWCSSLSTLTVPLYPRFFAELTGSDKGTVSVLKIFFWIFYVVVQFWRDILARGSEQTNRENVLDWEVTVPDWPKGGLHTHTSLKIRILRHTDISLSGFCVHSLRTGSYDRLKMFAENFLIEISPLDKISQ
jgi:hypothetical protein